jgi:hypothetical protein
MLCHFRTRPYYSVSLIPSSWCGVMVKVSALFVNQRPNLGRDNIFFLSFIIRLLYTCQA